MDNEWLTTEEVAKYLKVSATTVYRYADQGILNKHKIGRFNRFKKSEVDEAMTTGQGEENNQETEIEINFTEPGNAKRDKS